MTTFLRQGRRPVLTLGLSAVGLAVTILIATAPIRLPLSNDGAQYLSGSIHLARGEGFRTSLLYFDEQYGTGELPAPQTVWPVGLPLLVSGLNRLGTEPAPAARTVAAFSLIAVLLLGALLSQRLVPDLALGWASLAWLGGMGALWRYGIVVNSDLPFAAAVLATLLAVPREGDPRSRWAWVGLLAAAATCLRYSGFFLVGAMGLTALGEAWPGRGRSWRRRFAPAWLVALGALPAGLLLARNVALTGTLSGGNSKPVTQPLIGLLLETATGLADLLGGVAPAAFRGGLLPLAAGLAGLAGLLLLGFAVVPGLRRGPAGDGEDALARALILFVGVYLALMIATASRTMLTFGPRYLLPVAPVLALLAMRFAARGGQRRLALVAVGGLVVAQTGALPRRLASEQSPEQPAPDLVAAVDRLAGSGGPVLVVGGSQRFAWALGHPAAIVPHEQFTAREWSDSLLLATARHYRIKAVVVETGATAKYGPGAAALIAGHGATWLTDAGQFGPYRVFRASEGAP